MIVLKILLGTAALGLWVAAFIGIRRDWKSTPVLMRSCAAFAFALIWTAALT